MRKRPAIRTLLLAVGLLSASNSSRSVEVTVDVSRFSKESGATVEMDIDAVTISWPTDGGETGRIVLDLRAGRPLIRSLAASAAGGPFEPILERVSPIFEVTVGSRVAPQGRPPEMSVFNTFFDNPASRPHESHASRFDLRRAKATSEGRRASLTVGDLTIGPFAGEIVFTVFPGSRLVRIEAAVSTGEKERAFTYEAGLAGDASVWRRSAWMDTEGKFVHGEPRTESTRRPIAVRHRVIMAEGDKGSLALLPPPHQFFFPRDLTDNLSTVWTGKAGDGVGIGIRQPPTGGGNFVPWFNAPPGTRQRLSMYLVVSRGGAEDALFETLRLTHGDRYPAIPGHLTLTTHWHMAIAVASMTEEFRLQTPLPIPSLVKVFKGLGVNMVHLAEFHGDGHQADPGPLRIPELDAMFAECRRLSDGELLLIPGEESSTYLGISEPGKHPGHWMSLFPRPVYWTQKRADDQPFVDEDSKRGKVYHVGSRADMMRLLEAEHGLAWTAHPRIKASSWTPDIFRKEDFYVADYWLGAAWKAMPADLSRQKLGERALDLLDDMRNWGGRKWLPGEVDVFKIDPTHELYGHMNVNYVRMDRLPTFDEGWQPVLDALRAGRFFVTTGEVLIHDASLTEKNGLRAEIEWTFPLEFAEVISGDGEKVYRERIPLIDTTAFGRKVIERPLDLRGRRWARLEVWDTAANGAFTQPVELRP